MKYGDLIDEEEYLDLDDQFGIHAASEQDIDDENYFIASMGGYAVKKLLSNLDVVQTIKDLQEIVSDPKTSNQKEDF